MKGFYHTAFLKLKSRYYTFILLIFLGINLTTCKTTLSESSKLISLITENGKSIEPNFSGYILLIPNDGCHPCIEKALKLASKNLNHKYVYFVITTDFDFKSTRLKFSNTELLSDNLIFDENKISNPLGLHRSYLTIIYFKEGKKIYEKAVNPTNADIELLKLQTSIKNMNS